MISQRINKVLSTSGICSRRKVDDLIKDKKITVNGSFAVIGMRVNPAIDRIFINGKELEKLNKKSEIILLNKPKNVLTTCSDRHHRVTVIDLLPDHYKKGFFPIGRLDFLSRGALLITNDGEICYRLTHPKIEHKKTYIVKIFGALKNKDLDTWRSGVYLDEKKTSACEIKLIKKEKTSFILKITLREGKNRQIRRIASLFGYKVIDLQRINFANIALGNLKEGDWKVISNMHFKNRQ